jgi:mono/diheme cytochrome c family protein
MGLAAVGLLLLLPAPASAQWLELATPDRPVVDEVGVEVGRRIYESRCWFCHGEEGDGQGPIAEYLWPRPRDFTAGSYKLRTTESGELPTDEDMYRTVSLGIPGTAMPEWGSVLTPEERWQVIAYLKTFAADLFEDEAFDPYQFIVEPGTPPSDPRDSLIARGRRVFDEADCWECHGAGARGDGEKAAELEDDWRFPVLPADLRIAWKFKGGSTAREIYLRLSTGLDGTPMPSYSETTTDEERWQLAYYIASLFEAGKGERRAGAVITAVQVDGPLPSAPDDPAWEDVVPLRIPLSGQATYAPRWQVPAVSDLKVRAVYNAELIALRLAWDDRFADTLSADTARAFVEGWQAEDTYPVLYPDGRRVRGVFPDAAEIVFPSRKEGSPVLPHLVYGSAAQPVELLRWQADLRHAPGDPPALVKLRATGAGEAPESVAEENPLATAEGVWDDGRWMVVVRLPLSNPESSSEAGLWPGRSVPIAFHLWEGSNGETGLKMALSSWYVLYLKEPVSARNYLTVLLVVAGLLALEWGVVRWVRARAGQGRLSVYGINQGPSAGPLRE